MDDDNDLQCNFSQYEAAAIARRQENVKRIKEMGIYKYSLVRILYTHVHMHIRTCTHTFSTHSYMLTYIYISNYA